MKQMDKNDAILENGKLMDEHMEQVSGGVTVPPPNAPCCIKCGNILEDPYTAPRMCNSCRPPKLTFPK